MSEVIGIGAAPRRKEDLRFLTGRGNYVADIERPGMVFGVFVRSPHAHARIKSIDPGAALATPGVLAVFAGADLKFVPILLQKSFCTRDQNFFWLYTRLSCKDVGDFIA